MSWSPLVPAAPSNISDMKPAVAASTTAGNGKLKPALRLVLRGAKLGLDWIAPDRMVRVLVGHGDHAGMLRIEPSGPFRLGTVGLARPEDRCVQINLPLLFGMSVAARPMAPIEHEFNDGWIEVTIPPEWRVPRDHVAAPSKMVAPAQPEAKRPTGNATPPARAQQLAAAAAEMAARKAGRA